MIKNLLRTLTLKDFFLSNRFFLSFALVILVFILSFPFPVLFIVAQLILIVFFSVVFVDILILVQAQKFIKAKRLTPNHLSLGDPNKIKIDIKNDFMLGLSLEILDEIPDEFQIRDLRFNVDLGPKVQKTVDYSLHPKIRGEYRFYDINIFIKTTIGLAEKRLLVESKQDILVYPSMIQMKRYSLLALTRISFLKGIKNVRKIGLSHEFAQIRNYVKGDDFRTINWKATSRKNMLMVNQFQEQRSQQIFCVIDKGRSMQLPFDGMKLIDYAINTSLVISNISIQKKDKAGLLTFSNVIGSTIKADSKPTQLNKILETLYRQKSVNFESNFELLYTATKNFIKRRSLLFLFTNFESYTSMKRVLPLLRNINRKHLLVVVLFKNTELNDFVKKDAVTTEEIYYKTIASTFVEEKYKIAQEIKNYGIQVILTKPEDLSINSINKYLELKSRGLI